LHALVLSHDRSHLQIALDLLSNLLEAVDDRDRRYGVDARQRVQGRVYLAVLPGHFAVVDYSGGGRVHAEHGVGRAGVLLGPGSGFVSVDYGLRNEHKQTVMTLRNSYITRTCRPVDSHDGIPTST